MVEKLGWEGWESKVEWFKKSFEEREKGGGNERNSPKEDFFQERAWDFSEEQWPHWWWQTSCNTILDHMPSENYPPPAINRDTEAKLLCTYIRTTLRPITRRNNIIEQQKRPWPETLQLDTNVQICRVIELRNEGPKPSRDGEGKWLLINRISHHLSMTWFYLMTKIS